MITCWRDYVNALDAAMEEAYKCHLKLLCDDITSTYCMDVIIQLTFFMRVTGVNPVEIANGLCWANFLIEAEILAAEYLWCVLTSII